MTPERDDELKNLGRYGQLRSGRLPEWKALQPFLERIRARHAQLSAQSKPEIAGPQQKKEADSNIQKIASPPAGIPIAQQIGNVPLGIPVAQQIPQAIPIATPFAQSFGSIPQGIPIAGPAPAVATGSLAHGQQPIAGPPSNLSGAAPTLGASSSPVTAGGSPIGGGKGVAGSMGLGSQSGSLLSGGGAGTAGGQQDLLSAITELIEAIKDLTEKLGDDDDKKKANTPSTQRSGASSSAQPGGKDLISQGVQNAPGIEWANQMERWFASRFGRNNFGSG